VSGDASRAHACLPACRASPLRCQVRPWGEGVAARLVGAEGRRVAGVMFMYDFYPIMVEYQEKRKTILQFLTSIFAIVGGIFAVSG
jgi:hypothetical protein